MSSPELPYGPSAPTVASPPNSPPRARRGLGIASLVLSLVPGVVAIIFIVIAAVAGATDDSGWAVLGWIVFGVYVVGPLSVILGGTALGLGIAAAVKNRGRGPGIAGSVIGGLTLLLVLSVLGLILFGAAF